MKRVAVAVEGETEEEFVKQLPLASEIVEPFDGTSRRAQQMFVAALLHRPAPRRPDAQAGGALGAVLPPVVGGVAGERSS